VERRSAAAVPRRADLAWQAVRASLRLLRVSPVSDQFEARKPIMTIRPDAAGPDGAGWEIPADDAADEEVDVLSLAGQRPPGKGAWLWVTTADARHGGEFTALVLPSTRPRASGGDVLLHIAPGRGEDDGEPGPVPSARVRVWAVAAGSLILVAGWDRLDLVGWPERVRATAVFAAGVLRELQEHGADVRVREQVEVEAAAESPAAGFPGLPAWVTAGG
jgi:hypothetical protein